ncbi:MAG: thioredoxin family protein [Vicinamibacterales bacterium]|nr:thioredoxin family protein [Vicinamibacterales bacterium]
MRTPLVAAALVLLASNAGLAQLQRPKAVTTPYVDATGAPAGSTVRVALGVTLPDNLHVQSNTPSDPSLIATVLTIEPPAGVTVDEIAYPPSKPFNQAGLDQPLSVFEHEFVVGARLSIAASAAPGDLVLPGRLRYQACNDLMCFAPATVDVQWTLTIVAPGTAVTAQHPGVFSRVLFGQGANPVSQAGAGAAPAAGLAPAATAGDLAALDNFTIVATAGGYLNVDDFLSFVRDAESGTTSQGPFEGQGPLAIILIVLLGGMALNLTPCVLPMIPINLAIIGAGAQAGSRGRGFLLGSSYGAAMALVYGVLGLIVILTAGTFGTINASPWFNAAIAAVFVVLALAMFDVIEIDFSRFSAKIGTGGAKKGSVGLAFFMGAVAALLAGACVAPVVIQVVLFSSNLYAAGSTIALALPFVLGLGMALPWPLAGAGMSALPKPGAWMVRVKQVFGILILGTAIYYGYLAYTLFANRWVDSAAVQSSVEEKLKEGWHASLADGLAVAQREQKPVLIDLWATWCKNCLTMDKTTFADTTVKQALDGYVKIKFQAESPDDEPAKSVMQRFKAVGLPTYVILKPKGGAPER